MIIAILTSLTLMTIILFPVVKNSESADGVYLFFCLSLFGLALLSVLFEIFMDLYIFLPYDLYEVGLTVIIEDK